MRTWIIVGCLCICHAVNPEQVIPFHIGLIVIALIMAGAIMDAVEFFCKKGY